MILRRCIKCGDEKFLQYFPKSKQTIDGIYPYCKTCVSQNSRDWYKRKKEDLEFMEIRREKLRNSAQANKLKAIEYKGGECLDCGGAYPACVYDFHHEDKTTKERNPSAFLGRRLFENAISELDKCVLLCANCHRIRHFEDT